MTTPTMKVVAYRERYEVEAVSSVLSPGIGLVYAGRYGTVDSKEWCSWSRRRPASSAPSWPRPSTSPCRTSKTEWEVSAVILGWIPLAYILAAAALPHAGRPHGRRLRPQAVLRHRACRPSASWCWRRPSLPRLGAHRPSPAAGGRDRLPVRQHDGHGDARLSAPEERGRALGMQVGGVYLGLTLGPVLGGLITDGLGLALHLRHRGRGRGHQHRAHPPATAGRRMARAQAGVVRSDGLRHLGDRADACFSSASRCCRASPAGR